jgi:hypothetical protein
MCLPFLYPATTTFQKPNADTAPKKADLLNAELAAKSVFTKMIIFAPRRLEAS